MSKLSDEKIDEIARDYKAILLGGNPYFPWFDFARAIEAAVLEAQKQEQEPWPFSADRVTYHKAAPVVQPDMVMEGFKAACAFIDSHVADPDITSEMRKTYAEFMRMRTMIAAAEGKSNAGNERTPLAGGPLD